MFHANLSSLNPSIHPKTGQPSAPWVWRWAPRQFRHFQALSGLEGSSSNPPEHLPLPQAMGGFHAVDPKSSKWFIVIDLFWKGCQPPRFLSGKNYVCSGKTMLSILGFHMFSCIFQHLVTESWKCCNFSFTSDQLTKWKCGGIHILWKIMENHGKSWKIMENPHLFLTFDHF